MLANRLAAMKSARFLWSSADIPFEKLYDKAICRFLFNSLVFSYLVFWFFMQFQAFDYSWCFCRLTPSNSTPTLQRHMIETYVYL